MNAGAIDGKAAYHRIQFSDQGLGIIIPSAGLHLGLKPRKKEKIIIKIPGMNAGAIDGEAAYHKLQFSDQG